MKKPIKSQYDTFISLIFRVDNLIRVIGAVVSYEAKRLPVSQINNSYIGEIQSDVALFVLGLVIMLVLPDARKIIIARFTKDESNN